MCSEMAPDSAPVFFCYIDLEILLQMVAFFDLSSLELYWNWPIPFESPSGGKWAYSEKLKIMMSAMSDPPLVE